MNFWIPGIVLLLAFSLAGAAGLKNGNNRWNRAMSISRIKSMSRGEMTRMLERISRADEPEFVMGAMCYGVMAMPDVAEYVCPVCGGKTVYGPDQATNVLWGISTARTLVESISSHSDLEILFDESSFCDFCGPEESPPELVITVTYDDGTSHSSAVSVEELRMLAGVVSGDLTYSTSNDSQSPLKPNLDRLCSILGIEAPSE